MTHKIQTKGNATFIGRNCLHSLRNRCNHSCNWRFAQKHEKVDKQKEPFANFGGHADGSS
ncbi:hypothetical protein PL11_005690 [Lentilactobacillus curieae]|uniref:Uncharacterized protein n=1 Tax=Lentilactobacillus curieae TaxID=1138822 RepID=A0A1S6QIM3_9LACO|nr:hypothetical protein PL11_005690 [Lentilactobacillus curieae]